MSDSLDRLARPQRLSEGAYSWQVPDGWQQGRGAYGGLVLATLCRAATSHEEDSTRAPRAMNAEICGPVLSGEARIDVRVLRRGSAVTTLEATLTQEDEVRARSSFVLGAARSGARSFSAEPMQYRGPWNETPPLSMAGAGTPRFIDHFELRLTGRPPFTGGSEATTSGWLRPRIRGATLDAALVAAYADVWWPAGFSVERAPRPIATIAFHLQWLVDTATLESDLPLHCTLHVVGGEQGYVAETRQLHDTNGRLVALNQQTLVWI